MLHIVPRPRQGWIRHLFTPQAPTESKTTGLSMGACLFVTVPVFGWNLKRNRTETRDIIKQTSCKNSLATVGLSDRVLHISPPKNTPRVSPPQATLGSPTNPNRSHSARSYARFRSVLDCLVGVEAAPREGPCQLQRAVRAAAADVRAEQRLEMRGRGPSDAFGRLRRVRRSGPF